MANNKYLTVLATAGLLVAFDGCSADDGAAPTLSESSGALGATPPHCPGTAPPPPVCEEVYCLTGDNSWETRPQPAGTACQANGFCDGHGNCVTPPPPPPYSDKSFYFSSPGNRCVDFGGAAFWAPGAPAFVYGCNGTVAQQVRVKELDDSHDVELRVSTLYCLGVRGGAVAPGQPLELQACNGSPAQRFALDGDALLMGTQASGVVNRAYVIETQGARTKNRTPLVVGTRELTDAEYFRFRAVDGSASRPTSGFVQASNELTLDLALTKGWGTVIEVDPQQPLFFTGASTKSINAGVTLRGYRRLTDQGPEIVFRGKATAAAFEIRQSHVRVTGLRLRGDADTNPSSEWLNGIAVAAGPGSHALVDHVEMSRWRGSAVEVRGDDYAFSDVCPAGLTEWPRTPFAQTVGALLHDNNHYGVVSSTGAFALLQASVVYQNAHDVASDGRGNTGYGAYDNLVLSPYGGSHDFDVHGREHPGHWYDGIAGDATDMGWNTFLPDDHYNFDLRGTPCRFVAFHDNVTPQSLGDAINDQSEDPVKTVVYANAFDAPNPLAELAVADFDGDGLDDVFVGTGAGWYVSSGGQAEWRFLNRMGARASQLRFGDFDGDGRADVLALDAGTLTISWAGASPWNTLTTTAAASIDDLIVGDFDGDHLADVFHTNGTTWQYASAGTAAWQHFATSSYRAGQLRFGDFNHDGRTDVLGVVGGAWQMVPGAGQAWTPLRSALTSSLDGLVVADFDGDGTPDVAGQGGGAWRYSKSATGEWTVLRATFDALAGRPIGRFNNDAVADVIVWNGLAFDYAPGGRAPLARLSRQIMR